MKTIDFLPQQYRDKSARRRAGVWRLLVVALLGGTVAAASLGQLWHRRSLRAQLEELQPLYVDAQAKAAMLAQLQTELTHETAAATLCAYLKTPWPRTQIVSAMVMHATDQLHIEELHLIEGSATPATATTENPEASTALTSMSPATRDLTTIRAESATRMTHAEIVGTSPEAAAIHLYLERLEGSPLVTRAQLVSLTNVTVEGQPRLLRFTAQVTICPAPGAETSPPSASPAAETLTSSSQAVP
jgi:hypothetical protein